MWKINCESYKYPRGWMKFHIKSYKLHIDCVKKYNSNQCGSLQNEELWVHPGMCYGVGFLDWGLRYC